MSYEPGTRVLAIRNADEATVYAYGCGTYVGDHPYPGTGYTDRDRQIAEQAIRKGDANPLDVASYYAEEVAAGAITQAEADTKVAASIERRAADAARPMAERVDELLHLMSLNPKIVLEGGAGVVWGRECWWGPADDPRWEQMLAGRQVVTVPAPHPAEDGAS